MDVPAYGTVGRSCESARNSDIQFYTAIKEPGSVRNLSPHSVSTANDESCAPPGRHQGGAWRRGPRGFSRLFLTIRAACNLMGGRQCKFSNHYWRVLKS